MKIKAIIFDLDGTLLDTLGDLADSMNDALRRMAFPAHALPAYRQMVGDGAQTLATRALPAVHRDEATISKAYDLYRDSYSRRWDFDSPPFPGIPELLAALVERGVRLAVYSNKPDVFTQLVVAKLLPGWPWEVVLGQVEGTPKKPAPDGAVIVAKRLGLEPGEILFLGDSDVDILCANDAGMLSVGAGWGFRDREELRAAGAARLVDAPLEVLGLLG